MLTQVAATKAQAQADRYEKPDGLVAGLSLVVFPSSKKSWVLRYRSGGKQVKLTLGSFPIFSLADARDAARNVLVDVGAGKDPHAAKMQAKAGDTDRDLFENVLDKFLAAPGKKGERRERTVKEWRRLIEKDVIPAWRGKPIQSITRRDARDVLDAVVERGGGITANRVHTALKGLFNYAMARDIISASPMAGLDKPKPEATRDHVLSDAELRRLWLGLDTIEAPVKPFVRLLLLTGARRSEIGALRWSEIDTKEKTWLLPSSRSKNRQERLTPLSDEAMAVLASVPRGAAGDHVFSHSDGKRGMTCFNAMKRKLDELTKVTGWTLHDLRRTCSSTLHRLGFEPHTIEASLGHRHSVGVAAVYNRHQYANEKRQALDAWARFIVDNAAGRKPGNVVELPKRGRRA